MTNTKSTKRALLASVMAMLLCFTMLLGTTFAWFTDSATSANNKIVAGTLDVELYKYDGTQYVDISTNSDPVVDSTITWEPGRTEVVYLMIKNNGNLALKYTVGLNVQNVSKDLYKAMQYVITPDAQNGSVTSWDATNAKSVVLGTQTVTDAAVEMAPSAEHYFALSIHMDELAGNEYQDGKVHFDLTVLATQDTYENDSFGNQYDADAVYPVVYDHVVSNSAELVEAFKDGGSIQLTSDITLEERLTVSEGADVYLDLNGKKITTAGTAVDPVFYTYKDSTLVIDGNGTVELTKPAMSLIFPGGDVIINSGTFTRNVPEGTPAKEVGALIVGAKVSPWGSQTITINGGYFDGGYYDKNAADIEDLLAGTKKFTETEDDVAKRGNSGDKNLVRVAIKNNTQLTLNLSYNLMKIYGGTFVGVNPAWGDEGCMLPTNPNYLRPWSYYQGALLDGQTSHDDGIVLPEGYTITKGTTADGRPTYTVEYNK